MTIETMNIHQALVELKTLDKRIEAAINDGEWVVANKHSNTKISGVDLKDYAEHIKSRHQKVTSLIARAEAIKRAVVNSNAVTKVLIAGKEYTVAEAIDMKNNGVERKKKLIFRLHTDYSHAKAAAERANGAELERRADDYIRTMLGTTDIKGMTVEVQRMREKFISAQTMELVDPINALKQMELLNEEITAFETNVDSALSVSNALTNIEVSYQFSQILLPLENPKPCSFHVLAAHRSKTRKERPLRKFFFRNKKRKVLAGGLISAPVSKLRAQSSMVNAQIPKV